ncbi:hypothetical protein D3C73_1571840 [compost metagenome]
MLQPLAQCLTEDFFFLCKHGDDGVTVCGNFRIIFMVEVGNDWDDFFKEVLLNTKIEREANRAT